MNRMIDSRNINSVFDSKVVDQDDAKVGTVKQVFVDDDSGQPLFVSVATGLFGMSESFVPLQGATFDGDAVHVTFNKDMVKDAPRIDADDALTDPQQEQIWDYYFGAQGTDRRGDGHHEHGHHEHGRGEHARQEHGEGHRGGRDPQDAMTRSEERLRVDKQSVPTERARLRKHVVTEQQNITVPVQHEELRVEREPITDENVGEAMSGPNLTEDEHDVTLNEEQVRVDKETVPVEQVRLDKDTVTEQENISEDVAHEEIDLDTDDRRRRR